MASPIKLVAGGAAPGDSPVAAPTIAREAIAEAFDRIGGVAAFVAWIESSDDHRKTFYTTLYPKLLPLQGGDKGDAPLEPITRIELVAGGEGA